MKRRDVLKALAATSAAAALPIAAPRYIGTAEAAGADLKVGVLYPLSGTIAVIGKSLHSATMLAIDEINASGGVSGHKLKAIVRDPQSTPAVYAQKI